VLNLGVLAEPKRLVLFHHDPDRTDDALDAIGERSQHWIREHAKGTEVIVASESLTLEVDGK